MENSRRSFDRPRDSVIVKKPRISEEQDRGPNSNGHAFPHRPISSGITTASRLSGVRDYVSDDSGAYHPQPVQQHHELVSQYKTALAELIFNSKPIITNLTIIAGENLHVAKDVANVICTNILEVPSEQKLPSLYLLDSIVKNIGSDYIKYFATKLPEVFCTAYKQLDTSVHQSMRHLFGTWKGVFPLQTLQMIEKELGFSPVLNGSSSGAATSRSESQSQRPLHSIHVNPKYLERQRLQQSSRSIHRSQTDSPSDLYEKNIGGASYGEYDYSSDHSRNPGVGAGRTGGTKSNASDVMFTQKNGFTKHRLLNCSTTNTENADVQPHTIKSLGSRSSSGMSSSWKNSEEEEFIWDMHSRLSPHDAANISSNSKNDWALDKSEKLKLPDALDVGSRYDRESSIESLSSEHKDHTVYDKQATLPYPFRDSISTDGRVRSGASINTLPQSEGYSFTLGGLPPSASSSLGRKGIRPHVPSSYIGSSGSGIMLSSAAGAVGSSELPFQSFGTASASGQSPMHHSTPFPSVVVDIPQLVEQGLKKNHSRTLLDTKASQLPREFNHSSENSASIMPSGTKLATLSKHHPQDLANVSALVSSFHSGQNRFSQPLQLDVIQSELCGSSQKPLLSQVSDFGTNLTIENTSGYVVGSSGQSSNSSLLDDIMKSGILCHNSKYSIPNESLEDLEEPTSVPSIQPPLPNGPPPAMFVSSGPTGVSAHSHDRIFPSADVSTREVGIQPSLPGGLTTQTLDVESEASDPISDLLSSLVSKGLISAMKPKSQSHHLPQIEMQLQSQSTPNSTKSSMSVSFPPTKGSAINLHAAKGSAPAAKGPATLPAAKGSATLPAAKGSATLPPAKGSATLPAAKGSATLPVAKGSTTIPAAKGSATIPAAKGSATLPAAKGSATLPAAKGSATLPAAKGSATLPAAKGSATLPVAKGSATLPAAKGSATLPVAKGSAAKGSATLSALPAAKGCAALPVAKGTATLAATKGSAALPTAKGSATLPTSKGSATLPAAKGSATLPAAKGSATLPAAKGSATLSAAKGSATLPAAKGSAILPAAKGSTTLPAAKGSISLPAAKGSAVSLTAKLPAAKGRSGLPAGNGCGTLPAAKGSPTLLQPETEEIESLIGLEFRQDVIREFHITVINSLFDDLLHRCSLCGLHLKFKEQLNRHLEWHGKENIEANGPGKSLPRWYANSDDWVTGNLGSVVPETANSFDGSESITNDNEEMVPADENQSVCVLCGELFEDYFSQKEDQWMFKGAVYMTIPIENDDVGTTDAAVLRGPIVHANCGTENSVMDLGLLCPVKVEKDVV